MYITKFNHASNKFSIKSENKIRTLLETTALVDALPTAIEPPLTEYPKKADTLAIINAKKKRFYIRDPNKSFHKRIL